MVDLDTPPHPAPDPDTAGYWQAAAEGHLAIARCVECRTWQHPPSERCTACGGEVGFEPVSRRGTVFSRVSVHQPTVPGHLRDLPYVVVLVELDEGAGLRLPARVAPRSESSLAIGDRVELSLEPLAGSDFRVPVADILEPTL